MAALTPREMRIIADHVERLTKARVVNQQVGVSTTPDLFQVRFPNGYEGTVVWTLGSHGANAREHAALTRHTRHRDGYHLDMATLRIAGPKPAATALTQAGAHIGPGTLQGLAKTREPAPGPQAA